MVAVVSIAKARARKALRKFGPHRAGQEEFPNTAHVLWGHPRLPSPIQRITLADAECLVREGLATLTRSSHEFRCNLTIDGIAELEKLLAERPKARRPPRSSPPKAPSPKGVA